MPTGKYKQGDVANFPAHLDSCLAIYPQTGLMTTVQGNNPLELPNNSGLHVPGTLHTGILFL